MARDWKIGICGFALVALAMLAFALFGRPPYAFYSLLRLTVAVSAGLGSWALYTESKRYLPISICLLLVGGIHLFGSMRKSHWVPFNWGAIGSLLVLVMILLVNLLRQRPANAAQEDIGNAVPQDYAEDARLRRIAAEAGDAPSQSNLGVIYEQGPGVPPDYADAARWCHQAAQQGRPEAQSNLGFLYFNGKGVPQDYTEAAHWFGEAAERGQAEAQIRLGIMYSEGKGVLQDYVQAYKWLNRASANSQKPPFVLGQEARAILRDDVAAKMTPAQIAEAQRLSRE